MAAAAPVPVGLNSGPLDDDNNLAAWNQVALQLELNSGVALMELPSDYEAMPVVQRAFDATQQALQLIQHTPDQDASRIVPCIEPGASSAHVTGYHPAGGRNSLSRYNQYRQGFVWSDNGELSVEGVDQFTPACTDLFDLMHEISQQVLSAVERRLQLPPGWFQDALGPTRHHSQAHIKQYTEPVSSPVSPDNDDPSQNDQDGEEDNRNCDRQQVLHLLPTHTDPSLVSVLFHCRPGKQPGCQGLEYYQRRRRRGSSGSADPHEPDTATSALKDDNHEKDGDSGDDHWTEVPWSGCGVAVILVGSVLSYLTGGCVYAAAKHRVVAVPENRTEQQPLRMAATLFVRPRATAVLKVPPSPCLSHVTLKRGGLTFEEWNNRVARNYAKRKQKQSQRTGRQ